MAKDEATPGLFAKMVRFVKNPATNWSDLDEGGGKSSNFSKLALKEMIERKRRNDFVRKREFDMLRKIRRREEEVGVGNANDIVRPSFFQSSLPSKPDDRANTLKKIDEIEAQMSMQWWKTKHGTVPGEMRSSNFQASSVGNAEPSTQAPAAVVPGAGSGSAYAPTAPAELQSLAAAKSSTKTPQDMLSMEPAKPPVAAVPPAPPPARAKAPVFAPGGSFANTNTPDFSNSKLFAMEVDEVAHDPELEEAAIRFANGDDAGAEAGLLEALSSSGTRRGHLDTWLTLFDLYRATGQLDRFETAAIDFVGKFSRSAPQWFSMPDIVDKMTTQGRVVNASETGVKKADWICPSVVGLQTVAALTVALAKVPMPWRLNWVNVKSVEANAVEPLAKLITGWAEQEVQLRFMGEATLLKMVLDATPSGDRTVPEAWWRLRIAILRVMHRPDEFELAALDYCVTYEVSPPSWEDARCQYKSLDDDGGTLMQTIVGESVHSTLNSGLPTSLPGGLSDERTGASTQHTAQLTTVELAGQIEGEPGPVLDKLEVRLAGADILVISCARLIRVDFSAAGTLLNWVSARQNEGRQVHFSDVHRLVAAFFDVIGISEHAKVTSRRD
jgi:ABC-type transporter Mla MlaB component